MYTCTVCYTCRNVHIGHRHLVMEFSGDTGEEERIKRQTSVPGIEPGPSDWESSAPSEKPLPGTKVCLPILPRGVLTAQD